jgi:putative iron-dependent peroxidase
MQRSQPGILAPVPSQARYLTFLTRPQADPLSALGRLSELANGTDAVVGIGESLVLELGREIPGLRTFRGMVGPGVEAPSSPSALWCWLRGDDRGALVHAARCFRDALADAFTLETTTDAFRYGASLDLTGYEDGTENPEGEKAIEAAFVGSGNPGLPGSSFVAVQRWVHDLDHFQSMSQHAQDQIIGRRKSDNREIEDAPNSAHVKRTAQESFEPEAFVLRRSMPWADSENEGLVFVAFGRSFDAFEALLARMMGADDETTDALFRFTRPVSGNYYWCPPMSDGRLDLSALGLD